MSVTVDHEQLDVEGLGLRTVGQLLSYLQRDSRLVVNLLIDGREPDLDRLALVKQSRLADHVVFVETADPREMALEVLAEVETQLREADRLKGEAVDLLQRGGAASGAMGRLSGCFSTWHSAHESVVKTAQLLRLNLADVEVEGQTLAEFLTDFTCQLREIKGALESRDFVTLGDVLTYEMTGTTTQWRCALDAVRDLVQSAAA